LNVGLLLETAQKKNVLKYDNEEEKEKLNQLIDFVDNNSANLIYESNNRLQSSVEGNRGQGIWTCNRLSETYHPDFSAGEEYFHESMCETSTNRLQILTKASN